MGHVASIFSLKMDAAWPSETRVSCPTTTWCHNLKMEIARSSESLVSSHIHCVITWRQRQHYPPKRWYPATVQHVTPRKTTTWIIMATKSSSLPCFAFIVWFLSFLVIISASCTPILHKNAVNYVISKYNVEPFCNEHFRSLYTPSRTKKHCIRLVMFGLGEITCEEVGLTSHLWYVGESDDTLLITVQHRVHLITARVN